MTTPSVEVLENKFQNMKEQIEANKVQNALEHGELKKTFLDGIEMLSLKIDEIGSSKANKWVEKVLATFLILFGGGVLSFIGYYLWAAIKLIEKS